MTLTIVTKGYITLWCRGVQLSQHSVETKAIEAAVAHAEAHGGGEYELRFPNKIVTSKLTITVYNPDTTAPSAPVLTATASSATSVNLSWTASTDTAGGAQEAASGVVAYRLYRNGTQLVRQTGLTYADTVTAGSYTYTVKAEDAAGNLSDAGTAAVTTSSLPAWTIPDVVTDLGTFAPGTVIPLTPYYVTNGGTPVFTDDNPSVDVNSSTGAITAPLTASSYSVTVDLAAATTTTGDLPTLTVSSSSGAWTFGQPIKKTSATWLQGPTGTQVDIRNRWPDGSAKFAVISGVNVASATLTAAGSNPYTSNLITTSALASTTARIDFGSDFAAWTQASDWTSPHRTITSGPVMSSWTYRKQLGTDAHLVAWLEVRAYVNGQVEVLPWIENGYLSVAGPTTKSGRAKFTLNGEGTPRYDSINDFDLAGAYDGFVCVSMGVVSMPHHSRIVLLSGGTPAHWSSGSSLTPSHNSAYLQGTKLVPGFRVTTISESLLASYSTVYRPMALAYTPAAMGAAGYDESIGLLPEPMVAYVVSGDARAYKATLAGALSMGAYHLHYRDESTNRPLLFASHSTRTQLTTTPASTLVPYQYAASHHPSFPYAAYLISGWDWFAEESQLLTTGHYLARDPGQRNNANYYFWPGAGAKAPRADENSGARASAWQWRTCAMTAAITPDSDTTLRAQFVAALDYNATQWRNQHQYGTSDFQGTGPVSNWWLMVPNNLGIAWDPGLIVSNFWANTGQKLELGAFQQFFFAMTLGLTWDLEVTTQTTNLQWFRDFVYSGTVGLMGPAVSTQPPTSAANWDYRQAAIYSYWVGTATGNSTSFSWYADYGAAYVANYRTTSSWPGYAANGASIPLDGTARLVNTQGILLDSTMLTEGYWGNIQPAISYAVEHGATGALTSYNRMIAATNFDDFLSVQSDVPTWAMKPRNV